ncbi:autotransporter outer membrane beta-barrel domain-containing protein [Bradyrhizobium lablabi]|nr:autotransporter outer membrane beta-barrel domain-containing protein [Bradyrhizobium lablabi]MBR1122432.1 autotransporter outer membrane beta-barrel domain-containing protein [Bradyrhizobium lablabi]
MRCGLRASRAGVTGAIRRLVRTAAFAFAVSAVALSSAQAQLLPAPAPTPTPGLTIISSEISVNNAVTNLGSGYLERLGHRATNSLDRIGRNNPAGGGASQAVEAPKVRVWGEGYGISATTNPQGDFAGDRRTTWGGVVGAGATVAPGVNLGLSIDHSRSKIDVPLAFQSATLDLTQVGATFSVDKGPWTVAGAFVHGFGNINSVRDTGASLANAYYNARIDGGLIELDYYWTQGQSRIVPKVAFEYVRSSTDAFREIGPAFFLVTASGASAERARILAGAEVGHYFIIDRKILDLSAYGKFIDNVMQNFSTVTVSIPGFLPVSVQGIGESQYGADAGAAASLILSNNFRLYAHYDGKFRSQYQSHQGTVGLEIKW